MNKIGSILFSIIIFLLSMQIAQAKMLKIAVGLTIPPYVIVEESRGIEYDILKEALAVQGHEMVAYYVPLSRTLHLMKNRRVDGIMSTEQKGLPGCYTDPHITYWNFAISLESKNLKVSSISDLSNLRISSFQNASEYLGEEFNEMARANKRYREIADQSSQNKLLFNGRTDVVVADRYIFEWYRNDPEVQKYADTEQAVTHHQLFEPSHFSAVFKDPDICKDFNKGLAFLHETGRYKEIIKSYNVAEPNLIH